MERIVVISEYEFRKIIQEELNGFLKKIPTPTSVPEPKIANPDELITSIAGIAKLFNCCTTTAQSIKNSIPSGLYFQYYKKFAISKKVLLESYSYKRNKKKKR